SGYYNAARKTLTSAGDALICNLKFVIPNLQSHARLIANFKLRIANCKGDNRSLGFRQDRTYPMDLAWISLAALLVVMAVSCTSTVNAGLLAIALAWVLGIYVAPALGTPLTTKDLVAGFPTDLCLTLIGVTLLFSQAHVNGTLDRVARFAVRGCRGDLGLIPVMFFVLSLALSSIGAGNIAGTALMAPLAMVMAHRCGIPAFLMAIMVAHG